MGKIGYFGTLPLLLLMMMMYVWNTDGKVAAGKDSEHCAALGRAVKDFCSYPVVKKHCPNLCKDGKSPKLSCGKNLHTPKMKGLQDLQKPTKRTLKHLSHRGSKRVIGGEKSEQGEWPWHLTIRNYPKKEKTAVGARWCDATILTENFVLSAAHCFHPDLKYQVGHSNFSAEHMKVIAGDYNTVTKEEFEQEIQIAEYKSHPEFTGAFYDDKTLYNGQWAVMIHDFTLIKLASPIKLEDGNKEQVCIPKTDNHNTWKDAKCFSYGYGYTEEKKLANYIREVELPLVPLDECNAPKAYHDTVTEQHICAGYYEKGKSVCNFDSGASLVCKKNNRWFQLGLVSSGKLWNQTKGEDGLTKDKPCEAHDGDYGIFANVVKNLDWILETVLASK